MDAVQDDVEEAGPEKEDGMTSNGVMWKVAALATFFLTVLGRI